ncbi:hypothetical protein P4637_17555 [Halalkalibacterium halodurans]|uniref:hypothetical protein n=1 Tax=Halalkalibacterium halodurans TaxID=86665 RepID=UPI002E1F95F5|nr:hypothetical protein [Halalkalibacterium halodurans]MED4086621.1 hypothetical protein [Halalkalibacterium halodurans]MED4104517.1 hypothetical protein [Halalkalibacterium halodurans]MED4110123.1 hypothetical protein [Halalkalibacterium halodurans]MED4149767.1 hypothetical protein [Halalkalibacterium halodurans]
MDPKTRGLVIEVAKAAIKEYEQQKQVEHKRRHDNRLRNIKLLLKNYRKFKKHYEEAKQDIPKLTEALELEDLSDSEFKIQSILANRKRTAAMVVYIDRMLEVYKDDCERASSSAEKRRYQIIHELYLTDEKKSAEEVAKGHFLNKRTVYKEVDKACKDLSALMFGVDGVQFERV